MTLCVFVLIASEFMPVSLLTPITRDLGVTEGLAGQGIAISGALAVLTSLTLSTLAGKMNRKFLLLGMTVLMAVSGLIITLATSYLMYMVGRAMIGVAIGGFWSMSAATAIRLGRSIRSRVRWRFSTPVMRWRRSWPRRWEAIWGLRSDGEALSCAWCPWRLSPLSGSALVCPAWMRIKATRHVARYSAYLAAAWLWSA